MIKSLRFKQNHLVFAFCKTHLIFLLVFTFTNHVFGNSYAGKSESSLSSDNPAKMTFVAGECTPVSTLPCSSLVVGLPYTLSFASPVANTIVDKNGAGTGFTTVNPYSGTRLAVDGAPSNPIVPGYEPSKITVSGGRLQLVANKGIDYVNNNNQLNVLGVQTAAVSRLQLNVSVVNPLNAAQSQQAGLWYGLNDKTFVKLSINGNRVEMRKERNDITSTPANGNGDQRITGVISNLNNQTVRLRIIVDAAANTVEGFYSTDGINYINVGATYSTPSIGIADMGITGGASYAGIFASYRNGTAAVTYTFDDFIVSDITPPAQFQTVNINFRPSGSSAPTGYTADNGLPFDATRKFGWVNPVSKVPVSLAANSRLRTGSGDARQLSLIAMQANTAGQVPGTWEYALPNGSYRVTLSAGDNNYYDSNHQINVEGLPAVSDFIPNTTTKFRTATATVQVNDGKLTVDATGGVNSKINYITISLATGVADGTAPTAAARFVGSLQSPGNYNNQVQVFLTAADAGGSGLSSFQYSLNNGAFVNYTAPFNITSAGSYNLRVRGTDANNNQVTTPYNFNVVSPSNGATLTLQNMDNFPANDQLMFSYINTPWRRTSPAVTPYNANHDVVRLRIRSTGTGSLTVSNLALSDALNWKIVSINGDPAATLPIQINSGAYAEVAIQFMARNLGTRIHIFADNLTITSNDNAAPNKIVTLRGLWQNKGEGQNEPYGQEVLNAFGFTSQTGFMHDDGAVDGTAIIPGSSEISASYFVRADNSKPVTVYQMNAYHGCCASTETFRYFAKGSSSLTALFTHDPLDGQSVLPRLRNSTTALAQGSFTPAGAFGVQASSSSSDRTKNVDGRIGLRVLRVYNSSGALVPNAYLFMMDYLGNSSTNYDYQDNIYYVENLTPESSGARMAEELAVTEESMVDKIQKNISVYPNPGTGNNINFNAVNFNPNEKVTITISTNTSDRILHSETLVTDESGNISLPLTLKNSLGRGIYIISTESESGVLRSKLLVE